MVDRQVRGAVRARVQQCLVSDGQQRSILLGIVFIRKEISLSIQNRVRCRLDIRASALAIPAVDAHASGVQHHACRKFRQNLFMCVCRVRSDRWPGRVYLSQHVLFCTLLFVHLRDWTAQTSRASNEEYLPHVNVSVLLRCSTELAAMQTACDSAPCIFDVSRLAIRRCAGST